MLREVKLKDQPVTAQTLNNRARPQWAQQSSTCELHTKQSSLEQRGWFSDDQNKLNGSSNHISNVKSGKRHSQARVMIGLSSIPRLQPLPWLALPGAISDCLSKTQGALEPQVYANEFWCMKWGSNILLSRPLCYIIKMIDFWMQCVVFGKV